MYWSVVEKKEKEFNLLIDNYNANAKYIKENKHIMIRALCIVFLQFVVYYTISYFVYRSLGLNTYSWFELVMIQALLFVSVSSLPLPGAVGISEGAFLRIYSMIYGSTILGSAMILTRGISFYLFMIVAAVAVIIAAMTNSKKIDIKNEQ